MAIKTIHLRSGHPQDTFIIFRRYLNLISFQKRMYESEQTQITRFFIVQNICVFPVDGTTSDELIRRLVSQKSKDPL